MKPIYRPYQSEDDFWRLREFLREVYLLNDRHEWSWHVSRLEYSRWHVLINCAHLRLEDVAFLWELDGQIVGLLMPDGAKGEAHFSVHPAFDTPELEAQALDVAETQLAAEQPNGKRKLYVWSPEHNTLRQNLLKQLKVLIRIL